MVETTPVTVLTGVAGAGRTMLLNRWLRQPAFAGAVVITHPLIGTTATCACCAPRDDLVRILRGLLPRARRGEISRIIVETADLTDPAAIREVLLSDVAVASVYRLDAIVAATDALSVAGRPDNQSSALA